MPKHTVELVVGLFVLAGLIALGVLAMQVGNLAGQRLLLESHFNAMS